MPVTLGSETPFLKLKLYVVVAIVSLLLLGAFVLILFLRISRNRKMRVKHSSSGSIPPVSKEIKAVETGTAIVVPSAAAGESVNRKVEDRRDEVRVEIRAAANGKSDESDDASFGNRSDETTSSSSAMERLSCNSDMGWGRWYGLRELETATRGFSEECVVGEGGYGIVYRGVLSDGSVVAVKNLLNNKGQAEKEFKVEVEAIGKVKHKNLVGLVGYCAEGPQRMLVYEYIDNGNLEQWLHGDVGPVSPLTWDIRMKVAIGTAKGLAYLHEGLEPKVVHRDIKSSNILLDRKWNAKVSDFGLAKLLGPESTHVTTRVMGTFGYVSPEYASTGMLNERSDVYSFGVLLMEIITGRSPIDYSRPPAEMNLVDWFKGMVANRRGEEVVDPLMQVQPPPRNLKRALLVCLRCIDLDVLKRPKMGQIVHMLEGEDFPFRVEPKSAKEKDSLSPREAVVSDRAPRRFEYSEIGKTGLDKSRWR